MGFGEAVEFGFRNYATFRGRTAPSAYWHWIVFVLMANVVASGVDATLPASGSLNLAVNVALVTPSIAITVRRLHDLDRSAGWLLLLLLISPAVMGVGVLGAFLLVVGSTIFTGRTDASLGEIGVFIGLFGVGALWLYALTKPGSPGANDYGPQPEGAPAESWTSRLGVTPPPVGPRTGTASALVTCLLFPPLGLDLVWTGARWRTRTKVIVTVAVGALAVTEFALWFALGI